MLSTRDIHGSDGTYSRRPIDHAGRNQDAQSLSVSATPRERTESRSISGEAIDLQAMAALSADLRLASDKDR